MSTSLYPLGMVSYNNRLPQGGYKSWKGKGVFSNPVGTTPSNIRPLTNLDPGNAFKTGFGLARPIKHYRKGRVIAIPPLTTDNYENQSTTLTAEIALLNYNLNRFVKSSKGASLGGGRGGMGLVSQIIQNPGQTSFSLNQPNEISNELTLNRECKTCSAVGVISSWYPNDTYLTENPIKLTTSGGFCCNEQRKALRRVLPANTYLPKTYYTTLQQYRQNRCKTFQQRAFNFITPQDLQRESVQLNNGEVTAAVLKLAKPGGPLLTANTYFANCQPNGEIYQALEGNIILRFINIIKNRSILSEIQLNEMYQLTTLASLLNFIKLLPQNDRIIVEGLYITFVNNPYVGVPLTGPTNPLGCKLVVYKPNNSQYAQQGSVKSSVRTLKLNVTTIQKNLNTFTYKYRNTVENPLLRNSNTVPFILKNKAPPCLQQTFLKRFQNPKTCFKNQNDYMDKYLDQSSFTSTFVSTGRTSE